MGAINREDLLGGKQVGVDSSNVDTVQYEAGTETLTVTFLDKGDGPSAYQYFGVTVTEAESLALAPSKGMWVWDNLRIRGTKDGHRKSYIRLF